MISINSIKNGMTIIIGKNLYSVTWFQHVKPGKGGAFVKTKLKNIRTGAVLDKTFRAEEPVEQAFLEQKTMEYLYQDGDLLWFMDTNDYEQMPVAKKVIGRGIKFMKENARVKVDFHEEKIVAVELPLFVKLRITETAPNYKGDTVSGGNKPATTETGAVIQVPMFVKIGDLIKVDTRNGEYIQRA